MEDEAKRYVYIDDIHPVIRIESAQECMIIPVKDFINGIREFSQSENQKVQLTTADEQAINVILGLD